MMLSMALYKARLYIKLLLLTETSNLSGGWNSPM